MMNWIFGLLALGVSMAFLVAASRAICRRLPTPPSARPVVFLLVFTALQSLLILAAGLFGLLAPWPLALASAAGLLLLVLGGETADERPSERPAPRTRWGIVYAALVVCGVIALAVKSLALSPYWPDALYYHLGKVAEWVRAEAFVHGFFRDPRIWFPAGFEVIETWWVVFLGRDAIIEFAGLQMLFLALAAVRSLACSLGYRADRVVAVYAFVPAVILHVTACGNDLAVGAMVLSGFALVAAGAPRPMQLFPILIGAGVKASVLFAAPGLLLFVFFARRPERFSRWAALAIVSLGVVVGGFWHARNLAMKGHPLYPVYGETATMPAYQAETSLQLYQLRQTIEDLPRRAADPEPFSAFAKGTTSWGWFIIPLGLPLMVGAVRRDPAYRRLALAFVVAWCSTLAFSPHHDFNLRFALWFPALPALAAGRVEVPVLRWAVVGTALLNFWATLVPSSLLTYDFARMPDETARGARVAWIMAGQLPTYLAYGSDFSRSPVFPLTAEELRASGVRQVWVVTRYRWLDEVPELKRVSGRLYEFSQGP